MNREILFKAKRIDNGEWVEGCIVIDQSRLDRFKYRIQPIESGVLYAPPIDPDTLCQYTGFTDKNGKKIWENDLLGHKLNRVEFLNGTYCINGDRSLFFEANTNEVIGNIFDNQEMLEVE